MNILIINYEYPPIGGGASNASYFLAKALEREGMKVSVMTSGFDKLPAYSEENNIHIYRLASLRRKADRSNMLEMLSFVISGFMNLKNIIQKEKTNVAIIFFSFPCGLLGPVLNRKFNVPYVISQRGGDVPGIVPMLRWLHLFLTPIRRRILRKANAVVANSIGLAEMSEKADPIPVKVIPNGVDTDYFSPGTKPDSEKIKFLFVGRFQPQKNLLYLLENFADLTNKTSIPVELTLIGDGYLKSQVLEKISELKIASGIVLSGWCEKEKLKTIYQQSDCFLNPSHYEGMPNVVLEAMACGLPVIASNVIGNNELVRDGQSGFLFKLDEPASFVEKMLKIVSDKNLRETMGTIARENVQNNFSWESSAKKYIELLQRVQ